MRAVLLDRGERQHRDPAPAASPAAAMSAQVISIQSRLGSVMGSLGLSPSVPGSPIVAVARCERSNRCRAQACRRIVLAGWPPLAAAADDAQRPLRRSTRSRSAPTGWPRPSTAASTRRSPTAPTAAYGLDVTIVPGGPQANNRILLPVGKIDFYHERQHAAGLRRGRAERADDRGRRACSRRTRRS